MTSPTPRELPALVERMRAKRHARFVASRSLPAILCPYDPESPDAYVRVLAVAWVREHLDRRPTYGGIHDSDTTEGVQPSL